MDEPAQPHTSELYLLRHGESTYNRQNLFTGWVDIPLTDHGMEQMQDAGRRLEGRRIDIAFCSSLFRTVESARIALRSAHMASVPLVISDQLNERRYGALEGLNKEETAKKYGAEQVRRWRRSFTEAPPGGESLETAAVRIIGYFEESIRPQLEKGNAVLVCAHGNTLRAIIRKLEGLSDEQLMNLEIATGELIHYRFGPDGNVASKENIT